MAYICAISFSYFVLYLFLKINRLSKATVPSSIQHGSRNIYFYTYIILFTFTKLFLNLNVLSLVIMIHTF